MGNNIMFNRYRIGDGALLIPCREHLIESGHDIYGVITSNPSILEWAGDMGIEPAGRTI